jgi:uncharacterized protein (TIGR00369 family)
MIDLEMVRTHLNMSVPFAAHAGVELTDVQPGTATARLPQSSVSINHIGTQHAGALFTLAEAASGGAMAGAFAAELASIRPVTASAEIEFLRRASGTIVAHAALCEEIDLIRQRLDAEQRASFDVDVTLVDEQQHNVAKMKVRWHLQKI